MSKKKHRVKAYVSEILNLFKHSTPRDYISLRNSLENLSPTHLRKVYSFTRSYREIIESALGTQSSATAIIGRMVESIKTHKKDKGDLTIPLEIELEDIPLLSEDTQRPDPSIIHETQYHGESRNPFNNNYLSP
mgnify:CR=1 FL=1